MFAWLALMWPLFGMAVGTKLSLSSVFSNFIRSKLFSPPDFDWDVVLYLRAARDVAGAPVPVPGRRRRPPQQVAPGGALPPKPRPTPNQAAGCERGWGPDPAAGRAGPRTLEFGTRQRQRHPTTRLPITPSPTQPDPVTPLIKTFPFAISLWAVTPLIYTLLLPEYRITELSMGVKGWGVAGFLRIWFCAHTPVVSPSTACSHHEHDGGVEELDGHG